MSTRGFQSHVFASSPTPSCVLLNTFVSRVHSGRTVESAKIARYRSERFTLTAFTAHGYPGDRNDERQQRGW